MDSMEKFSHRRLVQQLLVEMVKATQCPHCKRNRQDCERLYGIKNLFESDVVDNKRPRCLSNTLSISINDTK
jgi:hypothetical protein